MRKIVLILLCFILIMPNSIAYANLYFLKNSEEDNIKNIIESFYNTQYDAYLQMEYKDITPYLDMTKIQNQNKVIALKNLTARRKYIYQKGYCYIEKRRFPLEFNYKAIDINGNQANIILEIKLDAQNAYPPFICGGENIFKLIKMEDGWKITEHDYEDLSFYEISKEKLIREFQPKELAEMIDQEFSPDLKKEYKNFSDVELKNNVGILSLPAVNHYYSTSRAVEYANKYVYNRNTKFYDATSGGGDCTNFASQVLWYGFGANDTMNDILNKVMMVPGSYEEGWYAGPGGGSKNWESVEAFWTYMTSFKSIDTPGPRVVIVDSINSLDNGGIMQIDYYNDGRFDHTAILVDKITRKFAQHTENCYCYYSDYVGNKRFFNPYYFREIE
ncbi:amidase domain-containing protein [Caldicellulosiruptor sp. F32]|uniref:amidase domain-containing protein n=1 Tax=Caldicellulosiruptor sp. F32 TaxID=1214564 RepID=UPI0003A47993|nr:amidase domain-containing protein [Caldicellulosiruptor sp. F32]